jgi:glycerol uptake facilitator-like aquaporin
MSAARYDLGRRTAAEFLGSLLLLATVVGSGIMAERLAGGNQAIALLGNTIPTGAILVVLILVFGPVSGAHFNPLVTLVFTAKGEASRAEAFAYIPAQILGAIIGVWLAHLMFTEPILQISTKARPGIGQSVSEFVATFGLIATILGLQPHRADTTPLAVGLYITAAYWFTASTSFANPAVTIARCLTNSFSGIAPASVLPFLAGQTAGAVAGACVFGWLMRPSPAVTHPALIATPTVTLIPQASRQRSFRLIAVSYLVLWTFITTSPMTAHGCLQRARANPLSRASLSTVINQR